MGTPPAPAYPTLYFEIHQLKFLPQFAPFLAVYCHYIDNIFGIWCHHPNLKNGNVTWKCFQSTMNSYGNLTWTFTPPSQSTNFMDLTMTISPTGFSIALYEKPLNLYQYVPLHSSHVPGITKGFITGLIHQTLHLTTHTSNQKSALCPLFTQLCIHGHNPHALKSLFLATIK